jgi:hypothetical protein
LTSALIFGATSDGDGSSGLALALSSMPGTMGETCWESGGGGGTEVTRGGGDFRSSISTSESMFYEGVARIGI